MIFVTFEDAVAYLLALEPPQGTYPLAKAGATLQELAAIETALEVTMPPSLKRVYQTVALNWGRPALLDIPAIHYRNAGRYGRWHYPPVKDTGQWEVATCCNGTISVGAVSDKVWFTRIFSDERMLCADNLERFICCAASLRSEAMVYLSKDAEKVDAFLEDLLPAPIPRAFWRELALGSERYATLYRHDEIPAPYLWERIGFRFMNELLKGGYGSQHVKLSGTLQAGMMLKLMPRLQAHPALHDARPFMSLAAFCLQSPNQRSLRVFYDEGGYALTVNDDPKQIVVDDDAVVETIVEQYGVMSERPPR